MTDWLKEYLDAIRDDIDSSKQEVLSALETHEKNEMVHIKRIETRLAELDSWKNRATVVIGMIVFAIALQLGPTASAVVAAVF